MGGIDMDDTHQGMDEKQQKLLHELNKEIDLRRDPTDRKKPPITAELRHKIRDAAASDCADLQQAAAQLAYTATYNHFRIMATRYLDASRTEIDDLMQSFYLAVAQALPRYDGEHTLITYLRPFAVHEFSAARGNGQGNHLTRYYRNISLFILRAMRALESSGQMDPTNDSISAYIKCRFGKSISPKTIENYRRLAFAEIPVGEMPNAQTDDSPEAHVLRTEISEEVRSLIRHMSAPAKQYMEQVLEYIRKYDTAPTMAQRIEMCHTLQPELTQAQCQALIRSAAREFARAHNHWASPAQKGRSKHQTGLNRPIYTTQHETDLLHALQAEEGSIIEHIETHMPPRHLSDPESHTDQA